MIGPPTKEWGELPSPGRILCQTSTQEAQKNESISNSVRKGDVSIMHMGDTILAAAAAAEIDKIGAFSATS